MVKLPVGVVISLCLAGGLASIANGRDSSWSSLERPLHLPVLKPGGSCPLSRADRSVDFASFGIAAGIGLGPAYPIMPRSVLVIQTAETLGSRVWGGQKVLWFVHPRYHGPVLVRGRRIDGSGLVRFNRGDPPAAELRMPAGTSERPSFTRLRAAGCYAYQIDGSSFSRVIVFRAVGAP